MAQKNKISDKRFRNDLDPAHNLYEDWLEPDWRGSTVTSNLSGPKDPKLKDRSKFKFADEYQREVSTGYVVVSVQIGLSTMFRKNSKPSLPSNDSKKTDIKGAYKETDFERFYAWVN